MMFGIGDVMKMGLAAVVAGSLMFGIGHWRGDSAGYARAQSENRQAEFDQIKERMESDDEVADMDDAGLCALLGGVWRDGTCN